MGRMHTFVVTLRRESRDTNWGLRLVGGSDLATPLIVTRVTPGTPAGKELVRGDIIAKIDDYDARDLRHEDAQNLFRNAPKQIKLAVQRTCPSSQLYSLPHSPSSYSRVSTPNYYRQYFEDVNRDGHGSAALAPRSPLQSVPPPFRTPSPLPATAWRGPESLPRTPQPFQPQVEGEYRTYILSPESRNDDGVVDESITSQPYRTTPLVLPGAKVRREPGPTESYLRHHPNPAMRAPPHHDLRDTLMKQKVAESVLQRVVGEENKVVHKQFNSPINLYSDQNIANSIRQQTSPLPHKPTVMYDPAKSETYRVLQEQSLGDNVSEVPSPATQIFTPPVAKQKPVPPKPMKQSEAQPSGKQTTFVNSLQEEHIQQSNSFKRLMYHVLGETEF
ncbi:LIM domain-binding protein 3 isoform X3 [Danaus plexippus]|uniref:LIM domain-binding protein 3 isoform X3 n=1 Tax=Danaus plexippus TaxID=13037 RepID=UPI0013C45BA8|nr:LIM domain-binding protein 3 isoform X1 [Danaus plexippus plexippus]XP_032511327.1 LIM domain-binding protein 3 isoform X3 [Danaus plexippus]